MPDCECTAEFERSLHICVYNTETCMYIYVVSTPPPPNPTQPNPYVVVCHILVRGTPYLSIGEVSNFVTTHRKDNVWDALGDAGGGGGILVVD